MAGIALTSIDSILEEFMDFLASRDVCRRNFEGKIFYYPPDIVQWMSCDAAGSGTTNATRLLLKIYIDLATDTSDVSFSPAMNIEEINDHPILFAILVQMGCGHMIWEFSQFIEDNSLTEIPRHFYDRIILRLKESNTPLPENYEPSDFESLIKEFDFRRWTFCPAMNIFQMKEVYIEENHIIPVFSSQVINNKGGTANLLHFKIQTDLLEGSRLKFALKASDDVDSDFGKFYEFAVKVYQPEYNDVYRVESEAFRGFGNATYPEMFGIVKYLGEFTRYSGSNKSFTASETRHILLEFGEFDLDEFLATKRPPTLNKEIIAFWRSIFEIAQALKHLHQLDYKGVDGTAQRILGWHGDVKPDNILRVGSKFKLADFGLAKFKKRRKDELESVCMPGATLTYGSPEGDQAYRQKTRAHHLQTIDTWSFGCVLSAVATWVILGSLSYEKYNTWRECAIQTLHNRTKDEPGGKAPACNDAFHDGCKVLPEVLEWHIYLRNSSRRADTISCSVLDLVENGLLLEDPRKRLSAQELCDALERIASEAEKAYEVEIQCGTLKKESEETVKGLLKLDKLEL